MLTRWRVRWMALVLLARENVRRFGDFDLTTELEPLDVHLTLDEDTEAA